MSIIQLNRIEHILKNQVVQHFDKDDILKQKKNISDEELDSIILSRSFLLYCLKSVTGKPYLELIKFITDGFNDNGIDAVYYSEQKNELLICQSKWIKSGRGGVSKGDVLKFLKGVVDLLHLKLTKFNQKIVSHEEMIEKSIYAPNIKIRIMLVYSGNSLSSENLELINDKLSEFNDTDEDIFFTEYNLIKAYEFLKESIEGEPINADIDLLDWGLTNEPFKSYYGKISCGQIAELFQSNSKRIYSKNIRSFVGLTGVNNEIVTTLIKEPENFFYLNNGITLICKEAKKSPYHSGNRELGKFHLKDLSVVNGAQTVGSINYAFSKQPEKVSKAKVFLKLISLEEAHKDFDKEITIASNTQNKIEKRDFISLDSQQKRLLNEFYLSGYNYHIKRDGNKLIKDSTNYYFEEATIALACFQDDVDFSTYAKREIGKLWEDKAYNQMFNDKLKVSLLVNLIDVFRLVEVSLKGISPDKKLICSHGLYFLTHMIISNININELSNPKFNIKKYTHSKFVNDLPLYTNRLVQSFNKVSPNNKYPLSIFKNFKYCRSMKESILNIEGKPMIGQTLNLFDSLN